MQIFLMKTSFKQLISVVIQKYSFVLQLDYILSMMILQRHDVLWYDQNISFLYVLSHFRSPTIYHTMQLFSVIF